MESIKRLDETTIQVSLSAFLFEEDGVQVCFSPALKSAGYGNDKKEAIDSFKLIVEDFIESNLEKGKLENALLALGWSFDEGESIGDLDGKNFKKDEFEYSGIASNGTLFSYSGLIAARA